MTLGTNTSNSLTVNSNATFNGALNLNGSNLNTRLNTTESNVSNLQSSKLDKNNPTFTGTLTGNSIIDNGALTASGNVGLGTNTSNTLTINSNVLANGQTITPTQLGYLSGASSNLQSQISTNTTNITSNTNSITNLQNNKQDNLVLDTVPTSNSIKYLNSGSIFTALQNYVTSSSLTSTLSSYLTTSSAASTYQTISGMSSYVTSSSLSSTLSSYLTTSSAASTYQTISGMSSYLSTSTASSTYAPISNASLTGITSLNEVSEGVYNAGSGGALSLTYTSIKGVVYYSPSANYTLTLSSVPTSSTTATYTLTFIYNTKYFCNAISVNGTSYTMRAGNGLANITVNSSAVFVMQTITIAFLNSRTPTVITNVLSLY